MFSIKHSSSHGDRFLEGEQVTLENGIVYVTPKMGVHETWQFAGGVIYIMNSSGKTIQVYRLGSHKAEGKVCADSSSGDDY